MTLDRIELRGIRAVGTHGVLAEEQTRAQPFEVDVDIFADLRTAGRSDALDDTVDYGAVVERVVRIVAEEHHSLLERVAERIAEEVLDDGRVAEVRVSVRKIRPPIPADVATVGVRITRAR